MAERKTSPRPKARPPTKRPKARPDYVDLPSPDEGERPHGVERKAKGGLCRGMGAAKRGGSYKAG